MTFPGTDTERSTLARRQEAQELARFPAYLQQLDMESNGKSVRPVSYTHLTLPTTPYV